MWPINYFGGTIRGYFTNHRSYTPVIECQAFSSCPMYISGQGSESLTMN